KFVVRQKRWDMSIFYKAYRIAAHYQPDVVHSNGLVSSFYMWPIAAMMGLPLINGSIRNALSPGGFRWRLEKLLLDVSDYRVANSYAGLRSRSFCQNARRNIVIYNGFDFSRVES